MMKKMILAAGLVGALAGSARAADTALILWNSADPGSPETATGIGSADILTTSLGGISILASTANKDVMPNSLDASNIIIHNSDTTSQTLDFIVGANGYPGPSDEFKLSGTINLSLGAADLKGFYFVDGTDTLNGTAESVTGAEINNFDSGALSGPQAFSFNGFGSDPVGGPYGMAEWLQLTLAPGATVGVQSVSMEAVVPEPQTWVMGLVGFGLLGAMGFRRARTARFAI
jgi:hypothetical protein